MVPHTSPPPSDPAPELSPATLRALRDVLEERWRALEDADGRLHEAVHTAAREAKALGIRPEHLIVAMKRLESEIFAQRRAIRARDPEARVRFREWLVSSCLEAYFEERRSDASE